MPILTNSEKQSYDKAVNDLNGNTVETSVPQNAVFTDTDTVVDIQAGANVSIDKTDPLRPIISSSDTVYDDTAIQSKVDANTAKRSYPLSDEQKVLLSVISDATGLTGFSSVANIVVGNQSAYDNLGAGRDSNIIFLVSE